MAEKKLKSVAKATQAKISVKTKASVTTKSSVTKQVSVPAARSKVLPKDLAAVTKPIDAKVKKTLTPEERYRMVETAAYFIAEQHGFHGRSDEHWAAAEHQIAAITGQ